MKSRNIRALLALLLSVSALFLSTAVATAAQTGSQFNCNVTATGVNFPGYNIFNLSPTTAIGSIGVTCNAPPQNPFAPLSVTVTVSPGSSGSFAQRQMTSAKGDRLYYNIYTDPSYVTVLGDGNGSSRVLTNIVTKNTPWNTSYFARIPPGQDSPAGSYSDTLTVTIIW